VGAARTQAEQSGHRFKGIIDCGMSTFRLEGIGGMYKGLMPSMLAGVPYVGLQMTFYDMLKVRYPTSTRRTLYATRSSTSKSMGSPWAHVSEHGAYSFTSAVSGAAAAKASLPGHTQSSSPTHTHTHESTPRPRTPPAHTPRFLMGGARFSGRPSSLLA
jgi:hypothetical protein